MRELAIPKNWFNSTVSVAFIYDRPNESFTFIDYDLVGVLLEIEDKIKVWFPWHVIKAIAQLNVG